MATQYDGADRFYRESGYRVSWQESWAFNEIIARRDKWDGRLAGIVMQLHPPDALPLVRTALNNGKLDPSLRGLALDARDAIGTKEAGQQITAVLTADEPAELKTHALHLLARDEGDAWREVLDGDAMKDYLAKALGDTQLREGALAFIGETRLVPLLGDVVALACDAGTSPEQRLKALGTVQRVASRAKRNDTAPFLKPIAALIESADPQTCAAAVKAIGAFKGDDPTDVLKAALVSARAPVEVRREALHALGASRSGANVLVALAEKHEVPQDLLLDATELLNSNSNEQIRLMAQKVLPRLATREGTALPPLTAMLAMSGDPAHGKDTFFSPDRAQCYRCHVIDGRQTRQAGLVESDKGEQGKSVRLDSQSERAIARMQSVDCDVVRGGRVERIHRSDTTEAVEMMDSAGNVRLDPNIWNGRSRRVANANGAGAALTAQELADIVAYLQTLK